MTVPTATVLASIQIKNPRFFAFEDSATQEGIVAVFIPFPTPVTTREMMNWTKPPTFPFGAPGPKEVTEMIVPMIMMIPPVNIIRLRPIRSPMKNEIRAPKNAPTS